MASALSARQAAAGEDEAAISSLCRVALILFDSCVPALISAGGKGGPRHSSLTTIGAAPGSSSTSLVSQLTRRGARGTAGPADATAGPQALASLQAFPSLILAIADKAKKLEQKFEALVTDLARTKLILDEMTHFAQQQRNENALLQQQLEGKGGKKRSSSKDRQQHGASSSRARSSSSSSSSPYEDGDGEGEEEDENDARHRPDHADSRRHSHSAGRGGQPGATSSRQRGVGGLAGGSKAAGRGGSQQPLHWSVGLAAQHIEDRMRSSLMHAEMGMGMGQGMRSSFSHGGYSISGPPTAVALPTGTGIASAAGGAARGGGAPSPGHFTVGTGQQQGGGPSAEAEDRGSGEDAGLSRADLQHIQEGQQDQQDMNTTALDITSRIGLSDSRATMMGAGDATLSASQFKGGQQGQEEGGQEEGLQRSQHQQQERLRQGQAASSAGNMGGPPLELTRLTSSAVSSYSGTMGQSQYTSASMLGSSQWQMQQTQQTHQQSQLAASQLGDTTVLLGGGGRGAGGGAGVGGGGVNGLPSSAANPLASSSASSSSSSSTSSSVSSSSPSCSPADEQRYKRQLQELQEEKQKVQAEALTLQRGMDMLQAECGYWMDRCTRMDATVQSLQRVIGAQREAIATLSGDAPSSSALPFSMAHAPVGFPAGPTASFFSSGAPISAYDAAVAQAYEGAVADLQQHMQTLRFSSQEEQQQWYQQQLQVLQEQMMQQRQQMEQEMAAGESAGGQQQWQQQGDGTSTAGLPPRAQCAGHMSRHEDRGQRYGRSEEEEEEDTQQQEDEDREERQREREEAMHREGMRHGFHREEEAENEEVVQQGSRESLGSDLQPRTGRVLGPHGSEGGSNTGSDSSRSGSRSSARSNAQNNNAGPRLDIRFSDELLEELEEEQQRSDNNQAQAQAQTRRAGASVDGQGSSRQQHPAQAADDDDDEAAFGELLSHMKEQRSGSQDQSREEQRHGGTTTTTTAAPPSSPGGGILKVSSAAAATGTIGGPGGGGVDARAGAGAPSPRRIRWAEELRAGEERERQAGAAGAAVTAASIASPERHHHQQQAQQQPVTPPGSPPSIRSPQASDWRAFAAHSTEGRGSSAKSQHLPQQFGSPGSPNSTFDDPDSIFAGMSMMEDEESAFEGQGEGSRLAQRQTGLQDERAEGRPANADVYSSAGGGAGAGGNGAGRQGTSTLRISLTSGHQLVLPASAGSPAPAPADGADAAEHAAVLSSTADSSPGHPWDSFTAPTSMKLQQQQATVDRTLDPKPASKIVWGSSGGRQDGDENAVRAGTYLPSSGSAAGAAAGASVPAGKTLPPVRTLVPPSPASSSAGSVAAASASPQLLRESGNTANTVRAAAHASSGASSSGSSGSSSSSSGGMSSGSTNPHLKSPRKPRAIVDLGRK